MAGCTALTEAPPTSAADEDDDEEVVEEDDEEDEEEEEEEAALAAAAIVPGGMVWSPSSPKSTATKRSARGLTRGCGSYAAALV